jgi:alpha-tubulin suppressor-like RCC1 family protein
VRFARLVAGGSHTCGLTADGEAYCWGEGYSGMLGDGDTASASTPQPVAGGHRFIELVSGSNANCGLTAKGEVWCWGHMVNTRWGEFVPRLSSGGVTFRSVFLGSGNFPCGVATDDRTYCMHSGWAQWEPTLLPGAEHLTLARIASSWASTCGVATDGAVYCWGNLDAGSGAVQFHQLAGAGGFVDLVAGWEYFCGRRAGGDYACWGKNTWAVWARDEPDFSDVPIPMGFPTDLTLVQITGVGDYHQCGREASGRTYCWGLRRIDLGSGEPPEEFGTQPVPRPVRRVRGLL